MKKVALGLAALAIAGYFIPAIGAPAVATALFLMPGYVLATMLGDKLNKLEAAAIAVASSFVVSVHAIYWASIALGYDRPAVTIAVALLCATGYFAKKLGKTDEEDWKPIAIAVALLILLLAMYHNNFWRETPAGIVVGGWNWSDLFVHLPIAQSMNLGNFPPQTPFYAGEPLAYHYFVDFHSAIAAKAMNAGLDGILEVMRIENSLLPALFFLLSFMLAKRITGRSDTAIIAAVLIVFGGGFSYVRIAEDAANGGQLLDLVKANAYDNDWKYFQIPSVMGGYLLVQRAQMVGLACVAAVLLLLVAARQEKDNKLYLMAGVLGGLLAPFHYFAFATAMAAIGIFLAFDYWDNRKKAMDLEKAAFGLLPAVLSLPFVIPALYATSKGGNVKLMLGWLAPKDPAGAVVFYLVNFGLPFIMALAAIAIVKNNWKKQLVALGAFALILPNVAALSGTVWDMAKFFTYMLVCAGILAAMALEDKNKLIVAAAIVLSVITPLQMLYWTANSDWVAMSRQEKAAGEWIAANTPPRAVFITTTTHISPVDSVGGRLRVVGYSSWMGNFGFDYNPREALVRQAYCGNAGAKSAAFMQLNATYIYVGPAEAREQACFTQEGLKQEFVNAEAAVYSLA